MASVTLAILISNAVVYSLMDQKVQHLLINLQIPHVDKAIAFCFLNQLFLKFESRVADLIPSTKSSKNAPALANLQWVRKNDA